MNSERASKPNMPRPTQVISTQSYKTFFINNLKKMKCVMLCLHNSHLIQNIHFQSENKKVFIVINVFFSILFYLVFILQIDAKNNVRQSTCSMTLYKTVTYQKIRVYANNTIESGRVISF